jgi:3-methyladenine DNA glycosylase/8-oxoguanine DNA glycosylase
MLETTRVWRAGRPVDVHLTLGSLRRGAGDPAYRTTPDGAVWRTARTPEGPGTLRLAVRRTDGTVEAAAWGPGRRWLLETVPPLLGEDDDPTGFVPAHPVLREAARRALGWRVTRSGLVFEALVPAVLEQKVTGTEARRSWRELLRSFGSPPPGPAPAGMRVVPAPDEWARVPSWDWHRAGVDGKRSRTIVLAAQVAARLEETLTMPRDEAARRLRAVPGVGAWTAAEVMQRAHGDPDAVSVGDFHLPNLVGWALAGRPVDDDGMLELLEPYRGHRYRAVRLVELSSGARPPRRAPRYSPRDYRAF